MPPDADVPGKSDSIVIAVRAPRKVHERVTAIAGELGVNYTDVLRLWLADIPHDTIPESLTVAARAIRVARGRA